ncbi:MAG: phosphoribosylamine--glycine ligase, partial [Anaerovoracaceae bacterium]
SEGVEKIFCLPGNPGIAEIAECVDIGAEDIPRIVDFAAENKIDLAIIGPEVPLAMGIVDELEAKGIKTFGPNKSCSRLEASKAFTKSFLARHNIPTAQYKEYTDIEEIKKDIGIYGFPMVIKADGLAAGKGVVIAQDEQTAEKAIDEMMGDKVFGAAGDRIVVEELLIGTEASVLCFVDENTIIPMESAQDYKRIFDKDKGPNTGGMGTYSPSLLFDEKLETIIRESILQPTLKGFQKDGLKFKGVLFIGIMITKDGPKVIEFNNRFGDPETQSVLPRLKTDLLEIMLATVDNRLSEIDIDWSDVRICSVVLASKGYPGAYRKGDVITGLDKLPEDTFAFQAGTKIRDGEVVTAGGRVLALTASGRTHDEARKKAYEAVNSVSFDGMQYRNDIGLILK